MKSSVLVWLLLAGAALAAGAVWHLHQRKDSSVAAVTQSPDASPEANAVASTSREDPGEKNDNPSTATAPKKVSPARGSSAIPRPAFGFEWSSVESADYKQYAANLSALGFPEELIRAMIMADLDELFAPREQPLKSKLVAYDAPMSARQSKPTADDADRLRQWRDVQREKQSALKDIFGIDVPREILRTPTSRNYDGCEFALSQLSPEKHESVQTALEDFWLADDAIKGSTNYVQSYKQLREQWAGIVSQALTPEEFERFQMNTMPPGHELARRIAGMEPTDAEMRAMWQLAYKCWTDSGGVYGLYRAVRVPPEQIAAAEKEMDEGFRQALGPDRYLDYQMATSETGQQLRNLAARYNLPRELLVQAFAWQNEADQLARTISRSLQAQARNPNNAPAPDLQNLIARQSELQGKAAELFGPVMWQAWQEGRNLRVDLQP